MTYHIPEGPAEIAAHLNALLANASPIDTVGRIGIMPDTLRTIVQMLLPNQPDEKLIRDKLRDRIPDAAIRQADPSEMLPLLSAKLTEEHAEIRDSDYQDPSEYADALEVLMTMAQRAGIPWETIEAERLAKLRQRGGFTVRLVYNASLDTSDRRSQSSDPRAHRLEAVGPTYRVTNA